jgi:hypothetical protein
MQAVPGLQDEAGRTVLAEAADFVVPEHAEGFGRVVWPVHVRGIEDVAQLVAAEAVGACVPGVQFGTQVRASVLYPSEGCAVVARTAPSSGSCR